MRIASHASQQYRKNAVAERPRQQKRTEPQASVKTTSFGFRLGKFGLDFQSRSTVLAPSLSHGVREKRQQAQAFNAEREVGNLRAKIGFESADYRRQGNGDFSASTPPPAHQVKSALSAYARHTKEILPPPGNMLAAVV